jgi:hypothetical protein
VEKGAGEPLRRSSERARGKIGDGIRMGRVAASDVKKARAFLDGIDRRK